MPTGAGKWKARWELGSSPCLSIPPSLSLNQLLLPTRTHWKTWPATESKYPDTWRNTGFLSWLHSRVLGSARYPSWPILAQQLALGLFCETMTVPPGGVIIREDSTTVQGHNPTQGCLSSLPQFPGRLGSSLSKWSTVKLKYLTNIPPDVTGSFQVCEGCSVFAWLCLILSVSSFKALLNRKVSGMSHKTT